MSPAPSGVDHLAFPLDASNARTVTGKGGVPLKPSTTYTTPPATSARCSHAHGADHATFRCCTDDSVNAGSDGLKFVFPGSNPIAFQSHPANSVATANINANCQTFGRRGTRTV